MNAVERIKSSAIKDAAICLGLQRHCWVKILIPVYIMSQQRFHLNPVVKPGFFQEKYLYQSRIGQAIIAAVAIVFEFTKKLPCLNQIPQPGK